MNEQVEQSKLAGIRRYNNLSRKFMAELIQVSERAYENKEVGRTQFKVSEMFIISNYFDMDPTEIFLPPDFIKHEVKRTKNEKGVK